MDETTATTLDSVSAELLSSFSDIGTELLDMVSGILPIALPVVGAVLVATLGIKMFKRVISK